jgi:hypothetical protein
MQIIRFQGGFVRIFPRVVRALNLSAETLPQEKNLPVISLVVACVEKDLYLLPQVLSNCINHSDNPISHISVIIPSNCTIEENVFLSLGVSIRFINEDNIISEALRIRLRERFKDRYGWVLQQLLTITYVMESKEAGVLVINADTLILRPQVWLLENEVQVLMESYEYHKPYYDFLRRFSLDEKKFKATHITHHMLMQPKYLRLIYSEFIHEDFTNLEYFVEQIIKFSNPRESSPICVEFELYALGMRTRFESKVRMRKFGNISVDKQTYSESSAKSFEQLNSVSLHSYLS